MKKVLIYTVLSFMALSFTACHDDPDYSQVTPPVVEVAPNTLKGVVTDMQGNPLTGATVTLGNQSATTDAEGVYSFSEVKEGTYTVTASATGMVSVSEEFVVAPSQTTQNLVWNATLAKINTTEVNVTVDNGGHGEVQSEALKDNDEGKVDISVSVPQDVVPQDTRISITPIYTEESASVSRASDDQTMLIGATLSCSDASLRLSEDIDLTFALDASVASSVVTKKFENGQWVEAPSAVVNGNVVIKARDFTSYGIFLKVNVSTRTATEALVFTQSLFDNLYGKNDIYVNAATFAYKVGTEITSKATNKLEGLLIEYLSRQFGSVVKSVQGAYPLDVTLPIGTALSLTGAQEVSSITVSGNAKSVTGKSYGSVAVRVTTYNRQHNGGTSGPIVGA